MAGRPQRLDQSGPLAGAEGHVDPEPLDRLGHPAGPRRQRVVVEERDGLLGELGVAAQGGDGFDDAWWRVLREAVEHRIPVLGQPGPHRLIADGVGQQRADHGEPVLAAHLGHGQVEGAEAQVDVGEPGQRAERAHLLLGRGRGPVALQAARRSRRAAGAATRRPAWPTRCRAGSDRRSRRRWARRRSAAPPPPGPRGRRQRSP